MLAIAFLAGTFLSVREAEMRRERFQLVPQTGLWGFLGALLGTKFYHYFQYPELHESGIWRTFIIWEGGYVFYGGLIGGMLGVGIHLRMRRTPLIKSADIAVPFLCLGQGIVRIGCFLNGCCWGRQTGVPWAVRFPKVSAVYAYMVDQNVIAEDADKTPAIHPTQLYMMLGLVMIFILLKLALKHKRFDGEVCLFYCYYYGALRFVVETYRGDSARSVLDMTVSQTVSLGLVLFAVLTFGAVKVYARRRVNAACEEQEDAVEPET